MTRSAAYDRYNDTVEDSDEGTINFDDFKVQNTQETCSPSIDPLQQAIIKWLSTFQDYIGEAAVITNFPEQLKDGTTLDKITKLVTKGLNTQRRDSEFLKKMAKSRDQLNFHHPQAHSPNLRISTEMGKMKEHLDFLNSDFAIFKEITNRLNQYQMQTLGHTAFD